MPQFNRYPLTQVDPGASGTIRPTYLTTYVPIVTAAAESRTLARPSRPGLRCVLGMKTDGGDMTLTVTGGYNEEGSTSLTFNDAGQYAEFVALDIGGTMTWRLTDTNALGAGALGAETLTALGTLTHSDNNKTFFLDLAAGFAVTLPAPLAGLRFKFFVKTAPSGGSYTIVTAGAPDQVLGGHVLTSQDAGGTADSESPLSGTTITLVDAKAVAGDAVTLECDGTSWYCVASSKVFDAITITG